MSGKEGEGRSRELDASSFRSKVSNTSPAFWPFFESSNTPRTAKGIYLRSIPSSSGSQETLKEVLSRGKRDASRLLLMD